VVKYITKFTLINLFYKLTPLRPLGVIGDASIVKPARLENVDILMVRENVGGLYFGENRDSTDAKGKKLTSLTFGYHEDEVNRILNIAFKLAFKRKQKVTVVVKQEAIPSISNLWLHCANEIKKDYAPIQLEILDIDNAAYQMIADPLRFDVVVSSNMFGDILADTGSLLLSSRGMSYSANFSEKGHGVFQTGHGAAYDIKDKDIANPIGQLHSLAMMLDMIYNLKTESQLILRSIEEVLAQNIRTLDIATPESKIVGTRAFGEFIIRAIETK
jgi:3-isopropylmalate dehydrogenase